MTATPVRVAGVTQATASYPWALLALACDLRAGDAVESVVEVSLWDAPPPVAVDDRLPVVLVREAGNRHDRNAIRVEIPSLAELGHHSHVGWIPAETARVYAERMDAGAEPRAWVRTVPVGSPANIRPGLVIDVDLPDPL